MRACNDLMKRYQIAKYNLQEAVSNYNAMITQYNNENGATKMFLQPELNQKKASVNLRKGIFNAVDKQLAELMSRNRVVAQP